MPKTESEALFERFCEENGIRCKRIETEPDAGVKTPDYDIYLSDLRILVEIKQFEPNADERRAWEDLQTKKKTGVLGVKPGQRVRKKIADAMPQLQRRARGQHPAVLVLYNNVSVSSRHTDPYSIKTGMYGLEVVDVAVPDDKSASPYATDQRFGPEQKVSPGHNTTLSAVAVLDKAADGKLYLTVYHNIHAHIAIDPEWLRLPAVRQFTLDDKTAGQFQEWVEIDAPDGEEGSDDPDPRMDATGTEQRERLLKSREWTLRTKHQASLDFDKAVMTLAGGALGLTVVFLDEVATPPFRVGGLLILAWLALTASLLAILTSHLCSVHAHEKLVETTDEVLRDPSNSEQDITWGGWGVATVSLNWSSTVLLIVGLLAFLSFAIVNQSSDDNSDRKPEGTIMTNQNGGNGEGRPEKAPGGYRGDKPAPAPPPAEKPGEERGYRPDKPPPPPPKPESTKE